MILSHLSLSGLSFLLLKCRSTFPTAGASVRWVSHGNLSFSISSQAHFSRKHSPASHRITLHHFLFIPLLHPSLWACIFIASFIFPPGHLSFSTPSTAEVFGRDSQRPLAKRTVSRKRRHICQKVKHRMEQRVQLLILWIVFLSIYTTKSGGTLKWPWLHLQLSEGFFWTPSEDWVCAA